MTHLDHLGSAFCRPRMRQENSNIPSLGKEQGLSNAVEVGLLVGVMQTTVPTASSKENEIGWSDDTHTE